MFDRPESDHHVRAILRCRDRDCPVLQSEAAARWALRHVAFNSGFELQVAGGPAWTAPPVSEPGEQVDFDLTLEMRDGAFMLRAQPSARQIELHILLGDGARELQRNIPRLVDELAAVSGAETVSISTMNPTPMRAESRDVPDRNRPAYLS